MKNILTVILFFTMTLAFADGHQELTCYHVPKQALQYPIGPMYPDKRLDLVITLPIPNKAERDRFLQDLYDPKSPEYRHYLTPQEYAQRFGPSQADYDAVAGFFRNLGFKVTTSPSRTLLDIAGPVKLIEAVFHTKLLLYKHPAENRDFYASDKNPSIDLDVPLSGVDGLDNYAKFHPLGEKIILSHPISALDKKAAAADEIFIKSGIEYQLGNLAQGAVGAFDNGQRSAENPLSPEEVVKVHQIILNSWSVQSVSPVVKDYIMYSLSSSGTDKALSWLNSSLGARITKLEDEASNPGNINVLQRYLQGLNNNLPGPERINLIRRWMDVSNAVEFYYEMYLAQMKSMTVYLARSASPQDQANAQKMESNIETSKAQIEANAQQQLLVLGLYTYKSLSDEELSKYVGFLASLEGREYSEVTQQALLKGIKSAQQKISDYLVDLIHSRGGGR